MAGERRSFMGCMLSAGTWLKLGGLARAAGGSPTHLDPVVVELLERNHERSPVYENGNSNHLSMSVLSLSALGGSADRLRAVSAHQWPGLKPFPTGGPTVDADNWQERLGDSAALPGLRALFRRLIASSGASTVLRRSLPTLLPGVGSSAFHCLIRTAYGARFRDDGELADGLAYWASAFARLGDLGSPGSLTDPIKAMAAVRASSLPGRFSGGGGNIFTAMKAAAALSGFVEAAALRPKGDTLARIADAAVRLYGAALVTHNGHFTALHAVTGTHAFRQLVPFIEDRDRALRYLWQAVAAAYIAVEAPDLAAAPNPAGAPDWTAIVAKAAVSLDAHDLKLVDIAREEDAQYHQAMYRAVAARRVKLVAA